jgi:peptidoglycan-associated lipoprotein
MNTMNAEHPMGARSLRAATLALFAGICLALSACSSTKLNEAKIENRSGTGSAPGGDAGGAGTGTGGVSGGAAQGSNIPTVPIAGRDPLDEPGGVLAKRSIYFDFDSFTIKDEYKPLIEAHAKYLSTNKGRRILIQGNTDDRGSREYNLALGQKRAEAVRRALAILGVPDAQMEAVSLGEEKPKAIGSDESAWAENRRADIAYQ